VSALDSNSTSGSQPGDPIDEMDVSDIEQDAETFIERYFERICGPGKFVTAGLADGVGSGVLHDYERTPAPVRALVTKRTGMNAADLHQRVYGDLTTYGYIYRLYYRPIFVLGANCRPVRVCFLSTMLAFCCVTGNLTTFMFRIASLIFVS
jgi:hypothetical protein